MSKPIIGISGSIIIDGSGNFPGYRRSYVNEDYVKSVIKNGGIPYIIPMNSSEEVIKEQIQNVDGLILSGGHDVSPRFYNQEPHKNLGGILPERDVFDFNLVKFAIEKNIPILGICRGFQILNVYYGGSLHQDVGLKKDTFIKHNQVNFPYLTTHSVELIDNTKLKEIFNEDTIMVNSFHHQIIDKVADGFITSAVSKDGVVEAIENPNYKYMLGVQWHPEMLHSSEEKMNLLFSELIKNTY